MPLIWSCKHGQDRERRSALSRDAVLKWGVDKVGDEMTLIYKSLATMQNKYDAFAMAGSLRALRTLAAVNQKLVRSSSESEFLQAACEIVVKTGGYLMAWVGFAEYGQDKGVRLVAQYGYEEGYLASTNITWASTGRGHGPAGSAIGTGRTQVNQNVLTNPLTAPWRKAALERGFQSSIGLPLKRDLGTFGALTIYAREPGAFGEGEVALLEAVAADLALGIGTLRSRAKHEHSAEQMRQYESRTHQGMEETIEADCAAIKGHDEHTYGHQKRVAALAVAIANEMGLPEIEVHGVKVAALVHDIGNLMVPAEILAKTDALSAIEYGLVQEHAQAGRDILEDITFPWAIADTVWQHHERLDGSGYPRGLQGDEILLGARVIGVADVVEAMASGRPYRPLLSMDVALQEIGRGRGVSFDSTVVDACVNVCRENRFVFPQVP
jgi:putative nucleotidyltransferase with HDIG domain